MSVNDKLQDVEKDRRLQLRRRWQRHVKADILINQLEIELRLLLGKLNHFLDGFFGVLATKLNHEKIEVG